jgi:hypothetical protein
MTTNKQHIQILTSALVADIISANRLQLIAILASQPEAIAVIEQFDSPKLKREFRLTNSDRYSEIDLLLEYQGNKVIYQGEEIGKIQILYKSPLPGELQARLSIESAIDRFLEYLQKEYKITVLDESDRHVRVFIPNKPIASFTELWEEFLKKVAFSAYGYPKYQLSGLVQTFIQMLNSVTISRGFSTLDVPILTQEQSDILASLYFATVEDVKNRQQRGIDKLVKQLKSSSLSDKDREAKEKEIQIKEEKKQSEAKRYTENFAKTFKFFLDEQNLAWLEVKAINDKLQQPSIKINQHSKLEDKLKKAQSKIILSVQSIENKRILLQESRGNPFEFIQLDIKHNPNKFQRIISLYKLFSDTAVDQINSSVCATFSKCIREMYRLIENEPNDPLPPPLLTEQVVFGEARSPGDDSKEFCYSCGVKLDPKTARWQVLRFMFERPSQRRQSSSSEGRPHICASCSVLAFASPLKVTDESIILQLQSADNSNTSELKIKDYLRMLTNKEMHLSAGRYLILASDKTNTGDLASQKMGQVQYALAKAASIFPVEVLTDFKFSLITQGSQNIILESRHLIFIKGLMESYGQQIINAGKEVNLTLGHAIRYIQQDLPYLADYTLTKVASISNKYQLEAIREMYWQTIQNDLKAKGVNMDSDNLAKKAKLYNDVAALTGITYAFAYSLEKTAEKANKGNDYVKREVSKLIEKVDDAIAFCYYATLGDENKKTVQGILYKDGDKYFIYEKAKKLLQDLEILDREKQSDKGQYYLNIYADDILKIYQHFASTSEYSQEKGWKDLTYNLKLSLYTRFPELVREQKSTKEQ